MNNDSHRSFCRNDDPNTFDNTYNAMQSRKMYDLATWRMHDRITNARMCRAQIRRDSGSLKEYSYYQRQAQIKFQVRISDREFTSDEELKYDNENEDDEIFTFDL